MSPKNNADQCAQVHQVERHNEISTLGEGQHFVDKQLKVLSYAAHINQI